MSSRSLLRPVGIAAASAVLLALTACTSSKPKPVATGSATGSASSSATSSASSGAESSPAPSRSTPTQSGTSVLNSYYPIKVGNTWVYKTDYGASSLGVVTYTEKVAKVVPAGADTNVTLQRSFHYENGTTKDLNVTAVYTFHKDGSISLPFQNGVGLPNTTVKVKSGEIVWPSAAELESGKAKTGKIVISATIAGHQFDETVAFEIQGKGVKPVTVPAGSFQAVPMEQNLKITIAGLPTGPTVIKTTSYLAKGTGMVKSILTGGPLPNGTTSPDVETVLVSFTNG